MMYDIIYESCPWHTRAALLDHWGRLLTLRFDEPTRPLIEGSIVLGRVRKLNAAMQSAFVDIGGQQDGVLPFSTVKTKLTEGQAVMVRVARGEWGEKGARLDGRVSIQAPTDAKPPQLIRRAPDALQRIQLDAANVPVRFWATRLDTYNELVERFGKEKVFLFAKHPGAQELIDQLELQLDYLLGPTFALPGGGQLHLEATSAVTTIDVDSERAKDINQVNQAAAQEVVRLCRLLDLGGSIIVDFITPKRKTPRREIVEQIKAEFQEHDTQRIAVQPMSPYGIVELNRERRGPRLDELTQAPAFVAGRVLLQAARDQQLAPKGLSIAADSGTFAHLKQALKQSEVLGYFGGDLKLREEPGWRAKATLTR